MAGKHYCKVCCQGNKTKLSCLLTPALNTNKTQSSKSLPISLSLMLILEKYTRIMLVPAYVTSTSALLRLAQVYGLNVAGFTITSLLLWIVLRSQDIVVYLLTPWEPMLLSSNFICFFLSLTPDDFTRQCGKCPGVKGLKRVINFF